MNEEIRATHDEHGSAYEVVVVHLEESPGVPSEIRDTILTALFAYRGDDYARAQQSFRGLTPAQMDVPYGLAGETCRQVLARHKAHADRVDAAAAWVRKGGA